MEKPREPAATGVELVEIDEELADQRIDNFLLGRLRGVPKSAIYRVLRRGEVRVNGGRIKPAYRLRAGDRVRVPPLRAAAPAAAAEPGRKVLQQVGASVLYEDDALLVLNKPSGLAVHGGSGLSYGIIEALRTLRPQARFLELVHRLDRETSGCLLIAKKRSALRSVHALLRAGHVDKRYLALVQGRWRGAARRVEAPLRKNVLRSGERMVSVGAEGKPALSLFKPLTIYADCSLMEVQLHTGRTHQIRVHAAHVGHPVAGDAKYGDAAFNREMARRGLKRLFLHARSLDFTLAEGRRVQVSAPLPADLKAVLAALEVNA